MIKLIALDLDDTLLDKNKNISYRNLQAIKEVLDKKIKIIIATGRPYFRVKPILEKLNILDDRNYEITFNGGSITNANHTTTYYEKTINNQKLKKISEAARKLDVCFNVYYHNQIYTSKIEPSILGLPVYQGIQFSYLSEDQIDTLVAAHKVIFADKEEKIKSIKQLVLHELQNDFSIVQSTPHFLEILPMHISKGEALKNLCMKLEIKPEEVMSIGDAENDVSMFDYAEICVAMGNAVSALKEKATFITKTCEEDGVAYAISTLLREEQNVE